MPSNEELKGANAGDEHGAEGVHRELDDLSDLLPHRQVLELHRRRQGGWNGFGGLGESWKVSRVVQKL